MKEKVIVCILALVAIILVFGIARKKNTGHGEITVYGNSGGVIEHFQDATYERTNDNTVIVYSGDRKIRYINCTIEVASGI